MIIFYYIIQFGHSQRTHTQSYERTCANHIPMSNFKDVLSRYNLEIDEVTTDILLSTGTSHTLKAQRY